MRLSDQGRQLFRLAYVPKHNMRAKLKALYTSDYDHELRELVDQSRDASVRLFAQYARGQDIFTMIENGLFNIHRSVSDCTPKSNKRSYEIYMDAAEAAHNEGDYNSALMFNTAMTRVTPRKRRKKDMRLHKFFDSTYGTERDNFAKHARHMLDGRMRPDDLPALQAFKDKTNVNAGSFIDALSFMHYNAPLSPIPLYNPRMMFDRRNTW